MTGQGDGDGGQDGQGAGTGTIEVDGKSYSAEDVTALLKEQGNATQALQQASPVLKLAESFGTDVNGLVQHVQSSTVAINKLIDAGLIDENGEIVEKGAPGGDQDQDFLKKLLGDQGGQGDLPSQGTKVDQTIAKTLSQMQEQMGETSKTLDYVVKENASLKRQMLNDRIKTEYTDLGDEDISRAMGKAQAEGIPLRKALDAINESGKEAKAKLSEEIQANLVKELGLTEEQIKKLKGANEFKELGPEGGAALILGKRKISFRKGENTATPMELMQEHFNRLS